MCAEDSSFNSISDIHHQKEDLTLALGSVYADEHPLFGISRLLLSQRLGNSLIPHGQGKAKGSTWDKMQSRLQENAKALRNFLVS